MKEAESVHLILVNNIQITNDKVSTCFTLIDKFQKLDLSTHKELNCPTVLRKMTLDFVEDLFNSKSSFAKQLQSYYDATVRFDDTMVRLNQLQN